MRPGDRKPIPTVAETVNRAAAICDPDAGDEVVSALVEGFEDDERPATAVPDPAAELEGTVTAIDAEGDSAAARMTAACAVWLSTNMDQADDPEHVLREAARLVFEGEPPVEVRQWLADQGVEA